MAHHIHILDHTAPTSAVEEWFEDVAPSRDSWRVKLHHVGYVPTTLVVVDCDELATMFLLRWGEHLFHTQLAFLYQQ